MYNNFRDVLQDTAKYLKENGKVVKPLKWQAIDVPIGMWEIFNYSFTCKVSDNIEELKEQIKPDLPWADVHFLERVCGHPINPPPSYLIWPYYKQDENWRRVDNKFSHTYPERMWTPQKQGIRYRYGNLEDVVRLLSVDPYTRQAFLPIWFPEDTGAAHGERVPCTIGYWFIHRDNTLNMMYPIRSCDFRRHLKNDIYLACRLLIWVLEKLKNEDIYYWKYIRPGTLSMQIWNLHVFEGEQNFI